MHILFLAFLLFSSVYGQTSTTTPTPFEPQCRCNFSTVWVDLMVILDSSQTSTSLGFAEMWGLATQFLGTLNLQKPGYPNTTFTTRLGVVTYGNSATVVSPLGTVTNNDVANTINPKYSGDSLTNMESGIQAAVAELNGPNHRSNAVRVIVILAAGYSASGVNDPTTVAKSFQQSGGILMTYNYQLDDGTVAPLPKVATAGYEMASWSYSPYDISRALCDANCFCPPNFKPFSNSQRLTPAGGCYLPITTPANYKLATTKCTSTYKAILSKDETADKSSYLSTILSGAQFLIGLTYDEIDRTWEWDDGSAPGSYQPWVGGSQPPGGNGNDCVFVTSSLQWQSTDCRNTYAYSCETQACDSDNYCA